MDDFDSVLVQIGAIQQVLSLARRYDLSVWKGHFGSRDLRNSSHGTKQSRQTDLNISFLF